MLNPAVRLDQRHRTPRPVGTRRVHSPSALLPVLFLVPGLLFPQAIYGLSLTPSQSQPHQQPLSRETFPITPRKCSSPSPGFSFSLTLLTLTDVTDLLTDSVKSETLPIIPPCTPNSQNRAWAPGGAPKSDCDPGSDPHRSGMGTGLMVLIMIHVEAQETRDLPTDSQPGLGLQASESQPPGSNTLSSWTETSHQKEQRLNRSQTHTPRDTSTAH